MTSVRTDGATGTIAGSSDGGGSACVVVGQRGCLGLIRQQIDHGTRIRVGDLGGRTERRVAWAEIDRDRRVVEGAVSLDQARRLRGRQRHVDHVGVEFDGKTLIGILRDGGGGARRRFNRDARAGAQLFLPDGDARHTQVADDQQARRPAKLEPLVVDRQQSAG